MKSLPKSKILLLWSLMVWIPVYSVHNFIMLSTNDLSYFFVSWGLTSNVFFWTTQKKKKKPPAFTKQVFISLHKIQNSEGLYMLFQCLILTSSSSNCLAKDLILFNFWNFSASFHPPSLTRPLIISSLFSIFLRKFLL